MFPIVIMLLSLVMSVTVLTALGLYVMRSWKALQAEEPGSIQHEILDRLDRIEMRLDLLSERIRDGGGSEALGGGAPAALGDGGASIPAEDGSGTDDVPPPDARNEPL